MPAREPSALRAGALAVAEHGPSGLRGCGSSAWMSGMRCHHGRRGLAGLPAVPPSAVAYPMLGLVGVRGARLCRRYVSRCRRLLCDPHRFVEPHQERCAGGGSLCGSCKHAHLYRRRDKLDPAVYCHELSRYVPPVIVVQSVPRRGGAESAADAGDRPADRSAARGHRRQLSPRVGRGKGGAGADMCYPYHR